MDDLPIELGDTRWVKGGAGNDLPGDREGRHADAIRLQIGSEHRRGRPEGCLAKGDSRESWDGMIGKPSSGDNDGAGAGGPHGWSSDLCDDDCTNDVDRISRLQMGDARAQQLIRSSHYRVIDDEPWGALAAVEGAYPCTQGVWIAGVCRDRVNLRTGVSQGVRKLTETVFAASDQRHSVSPRGKSASHRHSEARPGADQKQVTVVDRSGARCFFTAVGTFTPGAKLAYSVVGMSLFPFASTFLGAGFIQSLHKPPTSGSVRSG